MRRKKGPYDLSAEELRRMKPSRPITDEKEIFKLKLGARLSEILQTLERQEAIKKTGLDNADVSRLLCGGLSRFSIDRLIGILFKLGYTPELTLKRKKAS